MDKSLSIRLGRGSTIQDYDISIGMPIVPIADNSGFRSWIRMHIIWIKVASIQGRVYEQLYSPGALRRGINERIAIAKQLADELEETLLEQMSIEQSKVCFSQARYADDHC